MTPELKNLLNRTPEGRKIYASLVKSKSVSGEYTDTLGKGKKGKNIFQKIGKYTSKITAPVAKMAARIVGIPPESIDALAKVDPSAHKSLTAALVKSPAGTQAANAINKQGTGKPSIFSKIKPAYLIGGAAAIGAAAYFLTKKK
jgi:hypothetical protein